MLWLLASDHIDGIIDAEPKRLAFRLRMDADELTSALKPLIDNGFFEVIGDASEVLASCLQVAVPETEAETEAETETEYFAKTGSADSSPSPQSAGANSVQTSQADTCPHQAIIDLFHEVLPSVRHVRDWTPSRQASLRSRWREDVKRQDLDWWRRFFGYVGESDFLMGRVSSPGRKPFELGLEWLLKAENFAKVREGAYHGGDRP